jgi:hypothetical protein
MLRFLQLALDLVDLCLQLIVMQAVGDRIGGEVEEGYKDGGYVVLVFRDP